MFSARHIASPKCDSKEMRRQELAKKTKRMYNFSGGYLSMVDKEVKNRRIIIKDAEDDRTIADTEIISYDSGTHSILISADSIRDKRFHRICAIIFAENGLYKFHGTIRGTMRRQGIEVFLSKRETKKERRAVRYPVDLEGKIEGIYSDENIKMFHRAVPVHAVNMSSNGILLKTETRFFNIGEVYSLLLKTDIGTLKMQCEVVRIQETGFFSRDYGCRIANLQWTEKKRG